MARPVTFLILAMAIACAALFLLLPMSKVAERTAVDKIEPTYDVPVEEDSIEEVEARPQSATADDDTGLETVVSTLPNSIAVGGNVSDHDGAPISELEINLQSQGFDGEEVGSTQVLSDRYGNFTLQLVPQRLYRLEIEATANHAGYSLDGLSDANADDLQNIVLARIEPVDVDGMIVDTSLAPVGGFELVLRHQTLEIPERVIRSDSSGYFSLRSIPAGEWRVATSQANYVRIEGLELRPGEYRNLRLIIDRGNYHLSGWVHDPDGLPLEQVTVTLKSAFATDDYRSFSYRSIATDSSGNFEFADLGGNSMTLSIYAKGFETYIQQHDFATFSDRLEIQLRREESP